MLKSVHKSGASSGQVIYGVMSEELKSIERFNSLLVEYLNTFNLLETNVGLCISHLVDSSVEESHKLLARTNCEGKIKRLHEIVKSRNILKSKINFQELEDWCADAHQKRHQRNKYIHGHWTFLPHLENGVELNVAPWIKEKYGASERMSLQELDVIVHELKDCFRQLMAIRQNNGI